eukprot:CAMPEP_0174860668 /NCGR_PEP_ID=MMETSP1114-20130205/49751_1 /TAXON_ID=312471 /ORGANISM="Neobodo designis, Strain CCAP 1951/1" /LENGTH=38 /DNA_ID= /DNA_START= /DNA_END= /DNA_ORIENTATION=
MTLGGRSSENGGCGPTGAADARAAVSQATAREEKAGTH